LSPVVLLITGLCSCAHNFATTRGADAFLSTIYAAYQSPGGLDPARASLEDPSEYFSPETAALITDRKLKLSADPWGWSFDPFIDAQDWEISDVTVTVEQIGPTTASAVVLFTNLGKMTKTRYDLVKIEEGWRVHDIHWPHGSLRDWLLQSPN